MEKERFYFDSDNSGHNYLVPLKRKQEFEEWANLDPDDEKGWDEPDYVTRVEGETITFTDPKEL